MNLHEIESRLRLYFAVGQRMVDGESPSSILHGGKVLVTVDGRLEEVDIEKEPEWIEAQMKPLEDELDRTTNGWNALALAKKPSAKDFQNEVHKLRGFIAQLEGFRKVFLQMKHLRTPTAYDQGSNASKVLLLAEIAKALNALVDRSANEDTRGKPLPDATEAREDTTEADKERAEQEEKKKRWKEAKASAYARTKTFAEGNPKKKTAPMPLMREIVKQTHPEADENEQTHLARRLRGYANRSAMMKKTKAR